MQWRLINMRHCVRLVSRTWSVRGAESKAIFVCPLAVVVYYALKPDQPVIRMTRFSHSSCQKRPRPNTDGIGTRRYCKQHAETSKVDVVNRGFLHGSCIRRANCNVKGVKGAMYYRQYAENGLFNVLSRRCSHDSCLQYSRQHKVAVQETTCR